MPTIFKLDTFEFKVSSNVLKEFELKTLTPRLSESVKSKHLVFDIRQLNPGKYSFPYHFHRNAEELMMIISGSFTLRSQDGLRIINKGEIVFFEMGESGVHQFYNHENVPCIYLDIRTTVGIDIAEYPDSGKINILPYREIFDKHARVDYNKGEEIVLEKWNKLRQE